MWGGLGSLLGSLGASWWDLGGSGLQTGDFTMVWGLGSCEATEEG